jgi:ParB-like chromosome segregation protein Spo0J
VLAAYKLALVSVPCIVLGHLTATQRRAYVIADNRLTETGGGWNVDLLALELEDLRLEGFDIDLTGFDATALDSIMDEAAGVGEAGAGESAAREIDPDGFQLAHKCPKCGFEYD